MTFFIELLDDGWRRRDLDTYVDVCVGGCGNVKRNGDENGCAHSIYSIEQGKKRISF